MPDPAPETIAAAAILHDGEVWSVPPPGRHHDVIRAIAEARPETLPVEGGEAQGFLTDRGRFVTRIPAGEIALAAGQVAALRHGPDLYSEDLW